MSKLQTPYDLVGRYRQDDVNGFSREQIFRMLEAADLARAADVLDAMAGDGNLTLRMSEFCRERQIPLPKTRVLEFSRVQATFARHNLAPLGADVVWGDILGMTDLASQRPLPEAAYDRVLIKSANHEIPRERQPDSTGRASALRPGGLFSPWACCSNTRERTSCARDRPREGQPRGAARRRGQPLLPDPHELYSFSGSGFIDIRPPTIWTTPSDRMSSPSSISAPKFASGKTWSSRWPRSRP
jgi:hypothetical protein